ncbi:hypothetical protein CC1G_01411 [Coprinopsis cinerea okayama7|uniref:SET domain-containing protein n=1 Tax=Coprinopsis cinerea (strain Okayama-7 / 130 / ATCC MYA-4618 / FGSC 9003) TaxID=240176 RepID=A8NYR3_COPC7|nr:hypothetical protein CC1G_01411 [Coprinopsis cinerea okayama7\|eukprot:XP_001837499.2 hypothetical protein CC1G_01411 [Coprinopsis cinerea okayama7\
MESRSTVLTVAAVVATGVLAYAVYFDYKRRNDPDFRKKLKKEKKRVNKSLAASQQAEAAASAVSPAMLREALEALRSEPPVPLEDRENYFMAQVSMGEQLATQGPTFHLPAAIAFFRALRIYPAPAELIGIYEKTVPAPVFKLVLEMTNMDTRRPSHRTSQLFTSCPLILDRWMDGRNAGGYRLHVKKTPILIIYTLILPALRYLLFRFAFIHLLQHVLIHTSPPFARTIVSFQQVVARVTGYYDVFPPKSMNVSVVDQQTSTAMKGPRKVLVVNRDFAAGETIYKEHPIVAVLDSDLQIAGTHCTHCFRVIEPGLSITDENVSKIMPSAYCSKSCLVASKTRGHALLFTDESPLPKELLAGPMPDMLDSAGRQAAQQKFYDYLKSSNRNLPLVAARFIARQIVAETNRLASLASGIGAKPSPSTPGSGSEENDYVNAEDGDYQLADHLERWRFMDVVPPEGEMSLITDLLKQTLPGLDQFTTEERYAILSGKMAYNAFGVCFNGGRDDRPAPEVRPEEVEKTRTPYGTSRQIGSAVYTVSSYLTHSCDPSARVSFSSGTTELHLVANRDLKKGDVVTIAFVDVNQHPDESVAECKRRRRVELARGWKFACGCDRCEAEAREFPASQPQAEGAGAPSDPEEVVGDQSKVESSMENFEANPPAPISLNVVHDVE